MQRDYRRSNPKPIQSDVLLPARFLLLRIQQTTPPHGDQVFKYTGLWGTFLRSLHCSKNKAVAIGSKYRAWLTMIISMLMPVGFYFIFLIQESHIAQASLEVTV